MGPNRQRVYSDPPPVLAMGNKKEKEREDTEISSQSTSTSHTSSLSSLRLSQTTAHSNGHRRSVQKKESPKVIANTAELVIPHIPLSNLYSDHVNKPNALKKRNRRSKKQRKSVLK